MKLRISTSSLIILLCIVVLAGCSRKEHKFLNRNYHALTARDNVLFNGKEAFRLGRESLLNTYQDNYWDILPIERMEVKDEMRLANETENENFARAEEKAIKAIQKHGMNIKGKEYNPQMDEAYLLLGKARYFDQRFVPAKEAFNYILYKYPASNRINQAKIWREKVNIRLDNSELALKNLKQLLAQDSLIEGQNLADAKAMMAQTYINLEHLDSAIVELRTASKTTKVPDEKGRYSFILGQLYNKMGQTDSANVAFDEVIELNRKIPRIYLVTAQMEKARNFDYENGDKLAFSEWLTEIEENRENRPFLGRIYHETANFHLKEKRDSIAVVYFNKSLRERSPDKLLNAYNYQTLGDINFDKAIYKTAGAYYDSTLTQYKERTKPYRRVKKKRDNLEDVIKYEGIANATDSILSLVAMSASERETYFSKHIEQLKKEIEEAQKAEELVAQKQAQQQAIATAQTDKKQTQRRNSMGGPGVPSAQPDFYFYDDTRVAYGKAEFEKIWGKRELKDNWRWNNSSGSRSNSETLNTAEGEMASEEANELFNTEFYTAQIPSEEKVIDSIAGERDYAYYQLGLIYKEKFKEYELAKERLTNLLAFNPDDRFVVPAKYHLYKIHELLGETSASARVKNDIVTNHPDSRYAEILLNPEKALAHNAESPKNVYASVYKQFESQQYATVISACEEQIKRFEGDPIVPKFELLKATASGRLNGFDAYAEGINYVALTYPNSEEGQKAAEMSSEVLKKLSDSTFVDKNQSTDFKVAFPYNFSETENITTFVKSADSVIQQIAHFNLKTSVDVYTPDTKFVLVHGLKSYDGAEGFVQQLQDSLETLTIKPHFTISSENYRIVQIHKNLTSYLNN